MALHEITYYNLNITGNALPGKFSGPAKFNTRFNLAFLDKARKE